MEDHMYYFGRKKQVGVNVNNCTQWAPDSHHMFLETLGNGGLNERHSVGWILYSGPLKKKKWIKRGPRQKKRHSGINCVMLKMQLFRKYIFWICIPNNPTCLKNKNKNFFLRYLVESGGKTLYFHKLTIFYFTFLPPYFTSYILLTQN